MDGDRVDDGRRRVDERRDDVGKLFGVDGRHGFSGWRRSGWRNRGLGGGRLHAGSGR